MKIGSGIYFLSFLKHSFFFVGYYGTLFIETCNISLKAVLYLFVGCYPYRETLSPVGIYLLKVNNRKRTKCEICSKLTIKTPERRHWWPCSGVFIFNFEHISHHALVLLLLTLNM